MSWADYGVSNGLDGFKLNSKYQEASLPCGYKEALIEAVNERCDVVGIAQPFTGLPRLNASSQVNKTFQAKVDELIPYFVNHTDNAGNWDGQASIPNWTKADMLTHLGEAEIVYDNLSASISEWALQQYRLLNLMRSVSTTSFNGYELTHNKKNYIGIADWEDVVTSIKTATWELSPNAEDYIASYDKIAYPDQYGYLIGQHVLSFPVGYRVDIYIKSVGPPGSYDFQPIGVITREDVFNYVDTVFNVAIEKYIPTDVDIVAETFNDPITSPNQTTLNYYSNDPVLVIKYTSGSDNDFEFQDNTI